MKNKHVFYFFLPFTSIAQYAYQDVTLYIDTYHEHPDESWSGWQECPMGHHINGVQVRVESQAQGGGDNTALNGLKFSCTDGSVHTVAGGSYGSWSEWQRCEEDYVANEFRVRYEPYKGEKKFHKNLPYRKDEKDDTALNGLAIRCVHRSVPARGG